MISPEIGIVWRKEMLDILRDRRTIMAMIVVPLLVYPIIIIVISQLGIAQVEKIRSSTARVVVLPENGAPALMEALGADSTISVVFPEDPEAELEARVSRVRSFRLHQEGRYFDPGRYSPRGNQLASPGESGVRKLRDLPERSRSGCGRCLELLHGGGVKQIHLLESGL